VIPQVVDGHELRLDFKVADGTYLYEDKLEVQVEGDGVGVGPLKLPKAKIKPDTIKPDGTIGDVPVYVHDFQVTVPLLREKPEALTARVTVKYQGCAERGICYPPQKKVFELPLPPVKKVDAAGSATSKVARAIDHEMKRWGIDSVFIDISHRSKNFITEHFPNVYATCEKFGYDMSKEPIPVVPAAHYTCGGIVVDENGQTDIDNLYAIGECSFTGLHGANRMASNSLLECIVYGQFCAKDIINKINTNSTDFDIPEWDESRVTDSDERVVINHNWDEVRRFMWDYVGIVRTTKRLERARTRIEMLLHEIDEYYTNFRITSDLLELRNLAEVARLIIRSAQLRKESRGLHYTLDYPEKNPDLKHVNTILDPIRRPSNKG